MQTLSFESIRSIPSIDFLNFRILRQLSEIFYLIEEGSGDQYIYSDCFNFLIRVKNYIPRSGLLMIDYLDKVDVKGKKVLDIGTGETGILACYLKASGAEIVVGCDADKEVIAHIEHASSLSQEITWAVSDVYESLREDLYDIIVSNPPQMPTEDEDSGTLHDSGGKDGRDIIIRIIQGTPRHLRTGGALYLLCFDFLSVLERYNPSVPTLEEIAHQNGLDCKVVAEYERTIRPGGETEKNIDWIYKIYPKYRFRKTEKGFSYKALIVRLTKP